MNVPRSSTTQPTQARNLSYLPYTAVGLGNAFRVHVSPVNKRQPSGIDCRPGQREEPFLEKPSHNATVTPEHSDSPIRTNRYMRQRLIR